MSSSRSALGVLATLFVVLLIPQFYLAGAIAFGGEGFDAHNGLGLVLLAVSLIMLVLALVSRHLVILAAALLGLMVLQLLLASIGRDASTWIGALHAVNALAVAAVGGRLAHRAGVLGRRRRAA